MNVTTIINQNNKTLAFLQDEEYHSAIASSMSALASLSRDYKILSKDQAQPQSRSDPRSLDQCMLLNESLKEDPDISTPTFIYTCDIPLPPTITDLEIVTPIVVFNCALAQHLAVEERGASTEDQALQRAKKLYEIAHGSHSLTQNILFRFAVINNIAVIDRRLKNTEQSDQYICELMSLFMLLVDQNCDEELRQLRGFWVNVPSVSTAAGAA